jgi:phosphomannomutase / phosphoglucomutase
MIHETGFREYDARWRYPEQIDLAGVEELGLCLGTFFRTKHATPSVVCGRDFRSYAEDVQQALIRGLVRSGARVIDIGCVLSPMAYFAQIHLEADCVAMVTASHNPNGWTGVKMGYEPKLTLGPDDMSALKALVLAASGREMPGGVSEKTDIREAYIASVTTGPRLKRKLRVLCATGNGTASFFLPEVLERLGAEVVPLHTAPDWSFPNYNPNPEGHEMLDDMARAVHESGAELALGFDGDGDRCGVVDGQGREVSADKMGLLLARHWAPTNPGRTIIADVKSTGLFASDPVLQANDLKVEYWKTGHSYMKRRVNETDALAGFERSGHYYLNRPYGPGYDCAASAAVAILRLLDQTSQTLVELADDLPRTWLTPTLAPFAADTEKYAALEAISAALKAHVASGGDLAGRRITAMTEVNGLRLSLDHGGFALVRASSNTPNLVVVCESPDSEADLRTIFEALDHFIHADPRIGDYDQIW